MKLISWNVNGIRSVLKQGFLEFIETFQPDVLCLQETKAPAKELEFVLPGYHLSWNHAGKAGYSGVATFCKTEPLSVSKGMGIKEHDGEGRILTTEHPDFFVVNTYVPNSKRTLERLPYRQQWDKDYLKFLKKLEKKKPVIFCGDMNVAHQERDLTYPKANVKNHGFTPEEREGFDRILAGGFIDTFRVFEQGNGHYSWWSRMNKCRERNIGWRIDYFCISAKLRAKLKKSVILKDVMGSDHCPVMMELK